VTRVLIVEDERKLLRSIERGLRAEGYEAYGVLSGEEGLHLALSQEFDCAIFDRMLPGLDGLSLLTGLRRAGKTLPVLVLTAMDTIEDRVAGLDAGADDYLVKPFAFAELLARLRVLLRRGRGEPVLVLRAGDLEMDLVRRRVIRGGAEIALTGREFELLEYLLRHQGATVTRDMLGRDVWKEPAHALTNVIDVYVNFLRRKVEKNGRPLIHTVRGVGYCLRESPCP
jgi:two-component system, OmpR family, copper resistance phosphate regulon response regulator CusR